MPINKAISADVFKMAQSGNKGALDQIMVSYGKYIYSIAYRLTGNVSDAKDLSQQTLLKLMLNIDKVSTIESLAAWLKRTCLNLWIDITRKNKKFMLDDSINEPLNAQDYNSIYQKLDSDQIDLEYFLNKLNQNERLVVWMFSVIGYSHAEIANRLDISLSNSKQIFRRSLLKLKKIYENENNDD